MWHTLAAVMQALPDPDPAAPEELVAKTDNVLGFIKWGSFMAALGGLLGFGALVWATERSGHAGRSAEIKERFGGIVVVLVIVASATSIVSFVIA